MTAVSEYSKVTPELEQLASLCRANNTIDPQDYVRYDVKRGLRDLNGNGVVAGLTEISEVHAKERSMASRCRCRANCSTGAMPSRDIVHGFIDSGRFGFEETAYLLMFGQLPTAEQLADFNRQLAF